MHACVKRGPSLQDPCPWPRGLHSETARHPLGALEPVPALRGEATFHPLLVDGTRVPQLGRGGVRVKAQPPPPSHMAIAFLPWTLLEAHAAGWPPEVLPAAPGGLQGCGRTRGWETKCKGSDWTPGLSAPMQRAEGNPPADVGLWSPPPSWTPGLPRALAAVSPFQTGVWGRGPMVGGRSHRALLSESATERVTRS